MWLVNTASCGDPACSGHVSITQEASHVGEDTKAPGRGTSSRQVCLWSPLDARLKHRTPGTLPVLAG